MAPSLTLFFIVEPPGYLYMACHLAASIRKFMPPEVKLIGYCPAHRWDEMNPNAVEVLRRLRCEIRPIVTEGRFDPPYPHGNKILAALAPKETDFAAFLDSDMLLMQDCTIEELVSPGQIGMVPSTSMRWAPQTVWQDIYGHFDMPVPNERILMTRDQRQRVVPYFNAGLFVIDETFRTPDGQRFAEVWMDCAQTLDRHPTLENKRPYLDQMTLPLATLRAGMTWRIMPEKYNYSIGGILRGKSLESDADVTILHYRKREILDDAGLKGKPDEYMAELLGIKRVRWIFKVPPPPGIDPAPAVVPDKVPAEPVSTKPSPPEAAKEKAGRPDPSKAPMAAVTMVHEDHFFLDLWVRYWSDQIGRENLYVLCHGKDPQISRIAEGANIVHIPRTEDMSGFDRRRWLALSNFTGGLTLYYNWVICNDVDEIVAVDPAVSDNIVDYLNAKFAEGAPGTIAPFPIEIVHTPDSEPDALSPEKPVLSVRRNFRINSNYAKPCITRGRIRFSPGGHGSSQGKVQLDKNLTLFHLRYVDNTLSAARLEKRRQITSLESAPTEESARQASIWEDDPSAYARLSAGKPVAETMDFPDAYEKMLGGRNRADSGNWFFGKYRTSELYRLPERFSQIF